MKKCTFGLIGLMILGVAATTVACKVRDKKSQRRLFQASEEGYEIAHDIIYPDNHSSKRRKLRYGPVY
ncbi:hypothetical protein [Niabella ginsengisoli]|uniref:Quinol oxidase subunit 4 n=1 Tax=Niabella ginsengisoli TaxID=522298 RepID=A0ABS9SNF6_9BACT|nr:hypothetical protein [Niabella ginsengisoli]MCH5599868.1 hypothetical protein [Niabella ginsengisoli]